LIKVMEGVRVLEVAQFTFVPAAGAILADWGADVIKVEHPVRGDTQRGFVNMGGFQLDPDRHPLIEHPNRGKRSVGIDVSTPGGQEVLYEIAKTADVFLTNYVPAQRQKNKFDVEHIRAVNPNIIYARGSAYGDKGPERDTGGFDGTAFWTRSGAKPADSGCSLSGRSATSRPSSTVATMPAQGLADPAERGLVLDSWCHTRAPSSSTAGRLPALYCKIYS
jgi:crotonobetainyl-CoA:carnitine CoA-transferase CaiB-like acyl-CoA transferase